ncbi:putative periplasmic aspartyl protease [Labilithrix luteola]|uniref:Putative periplasmic aspartyl protease n=2 Tax=Labilithrix luteola TaxID=1391654 RepID=A0A0K1QCJ8_9BACT|nr:putative periplasmic aspartyl protease [Labilithrix luteola]
MFVDPILSTGVTLALQTGASSCVYVADGTEAARLAAGCALASLCRLSRRGEYGAFLTLARYFYGNNYSRGKGRPAAIPRGRAQPDVSLMAWGPDDEGRPSSFATLFEGLWRDDAGGTSVAAPIWAGIVARLNEARRERTCPRLGSVNPHLYRLAIDEPHVFRGIEEGSTDMVLPGLDGSARRRWFAVPGFRAEKGWNPATGLGVPDVAALESAIRSS